MGNGDSNNAAIVKDGFWIISGNGAATSLWSDVWLGESTLMEAFPGLYMISNQKSVQPYLDKHKPSYSGDFRVASHAGTNPYC